MDVVEKWQRALARFEAAEAEMRAVERLTAGGTVEEEEALQEVYDARLGDHSEALRRLMKARAPDLAALALKSNWPSTRRWGASPAGSFAWRR